MFLPHFHVFSDLLLYRPVATWNLFVLWDKKENVFHGDVIRVFVVQ